MSESTGQLLRRHLLARQMSQTVAADLTGFSAKHLNQVLQGHKMLSVELAVGLEHALQWPGLAEQALTLQVREHVAAEQSRVAALVTPGA